MVYPVSLIYILPCSNEMAIAGCLSYVQTHPNIISSLWNIYTSHFPISYPYIWWINHFKSLMFSAQTRKFWSSNHVAFSMVRSKRLMVNTSNQPCVVPKKIHMLHGFPWFSARCFVLFWWLNNHVSPFNTTFHHRTINKIFPGLAAPPELGLDVLMARGPWIRRTAGFVELPLAWGTP